MDHPEGVTEKNPHKSSLWVVEVSIIYTLYAQSLELLRKRLRPFEPYQLILQKLIPNTSTIEKTIPIPMEEKSDLAR